MTEAPPPSDRREALIAAAAAAFLDQGLTATRTRDVTARAGVGVGLLNHYFSWSELRGQALSRLLQAQIDAAFPDGAAQDPARAVARFLDLAFAPETARHWRLWIEATEGALADPALAQALDRGNRDLMARLAACLRAGAAQGVFACPDPEGAALRLLAAYDGLVGFVLTGSPAIDAAQATRHLAHAFALECPPGV